MKENLGIDMFVIGLCMAIISFPILISGLFYPTGNEKLLGYFLLFFLTGMGLFLMFYSLNSLEAKK